MKHTDIQTQIDALETYTLANTGGKPVEDEVRVCFGNFFRILNVVAHDNVAEGEKRRWSVWHVRDNKPV